MSERPSAFSRDLAELAQDLETVARSIGTETRLLRDEAMGAELVLTRELIEQWGVMIETADGLNDLLVRQAGHLLEDWLATLRQAASEPGQHNCRDLAIAHWQRRLEHLGEGGRDLYALVSAGSRKYADAAFAVWRPFVTVLGRDWNGPRAPADLP